MNCEKVRRDLSLLETGEIAPKREARILSHLDACAGCREAAATEERLDDLLAAWPDAEPTRDVAPAILRGLAAPASGDSVREWKRLLPRRRLAPLAAAAAVLVAIAGGGYLLRESKRAEPAAPEITLAATFGADPLPLASMASGIPFTVASSLEGR